MVATSLAPTPSRGPGHPGAQPELPTLTSLEQLLTLQRLHGPLYLRISRGPRTDERDGNRHAESGYLLPGTPAWPLAPEPWWAAGAGEWVARQLVQRSYLLSPQTVPWLLSGQVVGRGGDCEPLLRAVTPRALVGTPVLVEAENVYAAWRCRAFRQGAPELS